jgi:hypothetical protein
VPPELVTKLARSIGFYRSDLTAPESRREEDASADTE